MGQDLDLKIDLLSNEIYLAHARHDSFVDFGYEREFTRRLNFGFGRFYVFSAKSDSLHFRFPTIFKRNEPFSVFYLGKLQNERYFVQSDFYLGTLMSIENFVMARIPDERLRQAFLKGELYYSNSSVNSFVNQIIATIPDIVAFVSARTGDTEKALDHSLVSWQNDPSLKDKFNMKKARISLREVLASPLNSASPHIISHFHRFFSKIKHAKEAKEIPDYLRCYF